ncbi:hypothetical protein WKW80_05215 [Variovorax humicola]|uniref:Uncharacterized protein n=1 Tax=Variovorax humicola TaxID=1769758 RepID=A0ABU8VWF1_9BURK
MKNINRSPLTEVQASIVAINGQLADPTLTQASRAEIDTAIVAQIEAIHAAETERVVADMQKAAKGSSIDLMTTDTYGCSVDPTLAVSMLQDNTRAWITVAVGKDAMVERFRELLAVALPEGLDAEVRAQKRADLERQLIALELREEALALEAEARGEIIDPRPGQRPHAAILVGWGSHD